MTKITIDGFGFGATLATVMSYFDYHSIGWAILDGFLGWFYVLYRVL